MRTREEIEKDGTRVDLLMLEVLLDIRDVLDSAPKPKRVRRWQKKPKE